MRPILDPTPRRDRRGLWSRARSAAPLLAPFVVSAAFVLLYCGGNIRRGLDGIAGRELKLASGPKAWSELGAEGVRVFAPYDLGDHITRAVRRTCGDRPRWWSLDFWVNPDAQARVRVKNESSNGTRDAIARLFRHATDPTHVDLAIVQDGLIVDGELNDLNHAEPDQVQGLVPLYRSVFCVFARKTSPHRSLARMRGLGVRAYLGQEGSGARSLTLRVLGHFGVTCTDALADRSPDQVARAMTAHAPEATGLDVAFVLDKIDSGVVRKFVDSGQFDLVSIDGAEDLFKTDPVLAASTTIRPVTLGKGALTVENSVPSRPVTTIETQTILASSGDLPDWAAYRVARGLSEHFKELGLGNEPAQVPQSDPGSSFDYPIHPGADRFYRTRASSEGFPYQVLVVAIGASIALIAYWNTLALKARADRFTRRVDEILLDDHDPEAIALSLDAVRIRAVLSYKEGRLNKEGYDRVNEYITRFHEVAEHHEFQLVQAAI
jgi:TRAP-type uncharacterized transport system substrate-binding protein